MSTTAQKPTARRRKATGETYNSANPLAWITSQREVRARIEQARRILAWCEAHPAGGTVQTERGEMDLTRVEVAERAACARAIIATHGPEHLAFLRRAASRPRRTIRATVPAAVGEHIKREAARTGLTTAAVLRAIIAHSMAQPRLA